MRGIRGSIKKAEYSKTGIPKGIPQRVEKRATGTFFEDFVVKIFHLRGAFFLEKSAPHPCKKALCKGIFAICGLRLRALP